jgi:hypothetical protein
MNNTKSLKHKIARCLVKCVLLLNNVFKTNYLARRGLTLRGQLDIELYILDLFFLFDYFKNLFYY